MITLMLFLHVVILEHVSEALTLEVMARSGGQHATLATGTRAGRSQ